MFTVMGNILTVILWKDNADPVNQFASILQILINSTHTTQVEQTSLTKHILNCALHISQKGLSVYNYIFKMLNIWAMLCSEEMGFISSELTIYSVCL